MVDFAKFGVDAADVASLSHSGTKYPNAVPNRVAHIDADFMAYQVSAESKAELDEDDPTPRRSYDDMLHNAKAAVEHIRRMAGAEKAVLHTTHNSDKGGRDDQAILKEYQANRKDRENKPEMLDQIRVFLGAGVNDTTGVFVGRNHTDQEADDGMAQAHYADPANAIVCSMDKDLLMVPGWKMDMSTYRVYEVKDAFGDIWIDDSKSSKKCVGVGTKFFWAQLLMGDTADNISGLPECPGSVWQTYAGTARYLATYEKFIHASTTPEAEKHALALEKLCAKTKKCGPVLAHALLVCVRDDKEAFKLVRSCYDKLATEHGYEFKHWKTGKVVTPTQAMLSDMRLLWMRRYKDKDDVLHWIKEIMT